MAKLAKIFSWRIFLRIWYNARQLLMYSLDKRVSFSILLLTFISKNVPREALTFVLNYLIDYLKITHKLA